MKTLEKKAEDVALMRIKDTMNDKQISEYKKTKKFKNQVAEYQQLLTPPLVRSEV